MSDKLIEMNNIVKIYGKNDTEVKALAGVDLEVKAGELLSVMGASGSGKSTLLNILGAMDSATKGEYTFYGDEIIKVNELKNNQLHKFRKNNISFVFQQFALMKHYTVYENVEMPLRILGLSRKEKSERIFKALDELGITDLAKKKPTQISGGQQQRCAIARALVKNSKLILADEPTGALDRKNGEEIMKIFMELRKKGKTIIMVTHDPVVAGMTDRIINIEDGKIIKSSNIGIG